ncbi:MAG: hypothetical protein PHP95_07020 [Desulfuromonadaceae bacterium]|nr:hypothetical protein [Desulfuromonadaceae bacterium]MDD2848192.1 hypothetical protein [Desulfuromonadaceae bacterium]MDD4130641.1 hypothetical protein [Desulfuromonadaceae bacterium]
MCFIFTGTHDAQGSVQSSTDRMIIALALLDAINDDFVWFFFLTFPP